jgi:tetratricopeptide (TPR) repeat protein
MSEALDAAVEKHRRGDIAGAREAARAGLATSPDDVALLHFLGMIETRFGTRERAQELLERAVSAAPDFGPALVSLARLHAQYENWAALAALGHPVPVGPFGDEFLSLRARACHETGDRDAAANDLVALASRRPADRTAMFGAARALADADRFAEAEAAYRVILDGHPADNVALLGLTGLLESLSRPADLAAPFAAARKAGADSALVALGEAISHREQGDFTAGLAALDAARGVLPEATWQQMRGALADRAGDEAAAFAAFTAMNAADLSATPEAADGIRRYRDVLVAEMAALKDTPPPAPPSEKRAPPLFLLGFPRSGTTLLDTFLMGHAGVQVHEERPFLEAAAVLGGTPQQRATLDVAGVAAMRAAYWQALDSETDRPGALQVDKYPLASARASLIHALFPDAPILFALRHPCDVALSCFMTRFRLNWGVASFLSLEDTVVTYDRVMNLWTAARKQLPLKVHEVRYERLIAEPETLLREVAAFAGIEFDPVMLDHSGTARARGMIATPSHAQVAEPIYDRAVGRWRRYRSQLEPYLPMLKPWCDEFGYDLDG